MKKHIMLLTLCALLCSLAVSCATFQPKTAVEPDAATAKFKAVDAYVLIPRKADSQEATAATITGDDETVRWVPLKIKVNVPVDVSDNVPEKKAEP